MCHNQTRCEASWARLSIEQCIETLDAAVYWRSEAEAAEVLVESGRLAIDEEAVVACAEALERAPCGPMARLAFGFYMVPECRNIFTGLTPVDGECYTQPIFGTWFLAEMCELGSWCNAPVEEHCPGKCVPHVARGAECGLGHGTCDKRVDWCDHAGSGSCEARAAVGETCVHEDGCLLGLVCGGPEETRTCMVPKPDGEHCDSHAECQSQLCEATFVGGVFQEGVCTSTVPEGYVCYAPDQCPEGTRCMPGQDGGEFCKPSPWADEGEYCESQYDCRAGLACMYDPGEEAECLPMSLPGEPCGYSCTPAVDCNPETGLCKGYELPPVCLATGYREVY